MLRDIGFFFLIAEDVCAWVAFHTCVIFPLISKTFLGGYIEENANGEYIIGDMEKWPKPFSSTVQEKQKMDF